MFDFTNYTYSGMLSIVAAVFGIAYPLINSSIERIDEKYGSSMLTSRFSNEFHFYLFKWLLAVNLVVVVINPFLLDQSEYAYVYIAIQTIATMALMASFFLLYNTFQLYNAAGKLHEQIWADFKKTNKSSQSKAGIYFMEWTDLASFILRSSDTRAIRSIYDEWAEYIVGCYHVQERITFENYIYDGITQLNKRLCKEKYEPMTINNGNSFLTMFLLPYSYISENTYAMLWKNLICQVFYEKEEWVMSYWESASQLYEFHMQRISEYDVNPKTKRSYKPEEVEFHHKERQRFLEFHVMLGASFLQQGKYSLVKRMLFFTQNQPPTYPLVPSTLGECFRMFSLLNSLYKERPFVLDQRYPMPHLRGLSTGKIIGAANMFIALLAYRLYTLPQYPFGVEYVFGIPAVPDNSQDIQKAKEDMLALKYCIEQVSYRTEYLEIIGLGDIRQRIIKINEQYHSNIKCLDCYIEDYLEKSTIVDKDLKVSQPYSQKLIKEIKDSLLEGVERGLQQYSLFQKANSCSNVSTIPYLVNGTVCQLYPNHAFVDNSAVSYVDIDCSMSSAMLYKFRYYFATTFLSQNVRQFNVDSQSLFDAIDKLNLSPKKHVIIAFDVYLKYYIGKIEGLSESERTKNEYSYNGIQIYNFNSGSKALANYLYILNKNELPSLVFKEPTKDWKDKYKLENYKGNNYNIWVGLQKIADNPTLLSDEECIQIDGDPNELSLFACTLISNVIWKKEVKMLSIKSMYIGVDNGNSINVEDIKTFNSYFKTDGNE